MQIDHSAKQVKEFNSS